MLRRTRLVVAAATLALTATGCSDGASDPPDDPTTAPTTSATAGGSGIDPAVVRRELAAQFSGDAPQPSGVAEGECFATALLEAADPTELQAAGIVGDDGHVVTPIPVLDEATAGLWVDAQTGCVDFVDASTEAFAAQSKGKLDREAYAACFREALTADQLREAQVLALSGGIQSPEVARLTDAQAACATAALPRD